MALRSTQPVTEMGTRNLPGSKALLAVKSDNLTDICDPTVYKIWAPVRPKILWASTSSYKDSRTFFNAYIYSRLVIYNLKSRVNTIIYTRRRNVRIGTVQYVIR
jgi:hypothetical protein